ncbi:MAG: NmrA/HSCARG family protein [Mesorhizobium sp.]|uniref:NmrA/HSCARG family protein n=1 Tax=Mesorhizobium sp. TaxID=1871066 RepID=UPI000FE5A388|nr:NmrA/HSCARG family protein [Mesorhizobium sp.]RWM09604.1 MAG: NmrA/HSCARG family protein [Mesorhizobium sp.]TIO50953.1 MAG: NmrA/HSCARG family protein [Mesorhizobium sp.]TIO57848.1 MAG: NmrA/HSCARG family protein [Mesorhizobium sp.]TJV60637.1 MAG: NmrA/HSCARG family protein [Mesorhizobium sp.]
MSQADTSKPLITVVGASSKQGRSVANSLLDSGRYRVRALTRRLDSQPAQALAKKGAEVVVAPLELGRQTDLTEAMKGSAGAFLMTPPIVKVPPAEPELSLGKELADAAVAAGVEHVVFSGLENVEAITGGTKWAPHFTDKAKVEDYIRGLPVRSSFVYLAFYYTNFLEYYVPRGGEDGITFAIYLPPDIPMPFCDPLTAAGPPVREIFDHPVRYAGEVLPVIGEFISAQQMVDTFVRVAGKRAHYASAYSREDLLRHFPGFADNEHLVRELVGMVEYAVEYGYYAPERDLTWSRKIDPDAVTWEQILKRSKWQGDLLSFGAAPDAELAPT